MKDNILFRITEWITRFAYVNLLWMLFSIVGLVVFGFFPATVALFTLVRKWLMGQDDLPVFQTFWSTFKKEFVKSNLSGILVWILIGLAYLDLRYMDANANGWLSITHIPLYLFIFAVVMTIMYLFAVYVHFDISILQMFKHAFLIMLINPVNNALMIVGVAVTIYVFTLIPGLAFFYGGSAIAYNIMWPCLRAFAKVTKDKQG